MGAQRLNDKSRRRIERSTGLTIWRAFSFENTMRVFITTDHRHGWWNRLTEEWGWIEKPTHFTSCHEQFPGDFT
jgi:hypothetical protein